MKLTKRLLAIVLAAAMLVGMVAITSSAVQLDEDVTSLTWDDCAIDKDTNPYTVKMAFKIYKVDTASGEYTLLEDTDPLNNTLDVNVQPGDVLRFETWMQTNFHAINVQLSPAYNNEWLLPTKLDYTTFGDPSASYPLKSAKTADNVAMTDAFVPVVDFCDEYGTGDGTFEAPVFATEAMNQTKGQTNFNAFNALRAALPKDWQGTGTTEAKWLKTTAVDEWGNSIVDENGHLIYNVYQLGAGNLNGGAAPWTGFATVLNVYQPVAVFNLTVAEGATGTAKVFYPKSSYMETSSPTTWIQAYDYDTVLDSPNANGNWDESIPQVCASGITPSYKNTVTYPDGTVTDKNWIVTNAVLTVGGGTTPEPDTTTTTTQAPLDYTRIDNAINSVPADLSAFTASSAAAIAAPLAAAQDAKTNATEQTALDSAAAALEAAVGALKAKADFAALNAAVAAAEAKVAEGGWVSTADVEAAITAAKAFNQNDTSVDEQPAVNAAAQAVNDAAAALTKEVILSYAAWDAAVAKIPASTEGNTPNSIDAYTAAKDAAYAAKDAAVAAKDQAALDTAAADLEAAIALLTAKADKDALNAAIADVPAYAANYYSNWDAYATALAAAQAQAADENATQDAVNAAAAALVDAKGALALKAADYSAVEAAKAKIPADLANYIPATVDAVNNAVAAVEEGLDITKQAEVDAWAAAIEEAVAGLLQYADYSDVDAAITAAQAKVAQGGWTPSSVAAVEAAINAVVRDLDETKQETVDGYVDAINGAAAALVPQADKTALAAKIAAAAALEETDYTPDSWAAADLAAVLAAADLVNADVEATQADVDAQVDAIDAAVAKLVVKADKAALEAAIAAAKKLDEAAYTPASWADAAIAAAITAAEAVLADDNATAQAVADQIAALAAATEKLVVKTDKADLEAAIAAAQALNETDYTPASWADAAIAAAITAAEAVLADGNATAEDVAAQIAALKAAEDKLIEKADKTALNAAIADAPEYGADYYDNWADYAAALATAEEMAADVNASQDDVNAAEANLVAAKGALTLKAADYTAVDAAKDSIPADLSIYTSASVKAVEDAVAAVVTGYDITKQAEVDDMAKAINDAIAALAPLAACDYTALNAALALVPAEEQGAYTEATWKAYAKAKAEAEAIKPDLLADEAGVNQKAINDAAAALEEAYNNLKINVANVTSVDYDSTGVYSQASVEYAFKVNGAPSKLQVVTAGGSTMTVDRRSTKVSITSYDADGNVVDYATEDPAYEVWTMNLSLIAGDYTVRAKYDYVWDTESYAFAVEYDEYEATAESFTATVGEYVDATEVTAAKGDIITFKAVTDTTVTKIRMVLPGGSTSTYTTSKAVDNGDGTRTWTVTRTASASTTFNLVVKTPAGWGTESVGSVVITVG